MAADDQPRKVRSSNALLGFVVVIAVLYFARDVLIPLTLAVLLAFLLAPVSSRLRHWGLPRVPSSLLVVILAFAILGGICVLLASQTSDLAKKLPGYQQNIRSKVEKIRNSGSGIINRITRFTHTVSDELLPSNPPPSAKNVPTEEKPVPVEIRKNVFNPLEFAQKLLGSVLNILVTVAIVIVFVIFILIQQEDLRDRLIRLVGAGRLNLTTKALDDAAHRLSRYLLAQLFINVGFGVAAGIGLFFIGVPNPFLWAIIAAVMRYVPYLGIWVAAIMPALIAFAVESGWVKVPVIFGLYFGIDLLMYNFVEPYLYGSSTGISPLAILAAAVFWTWLWGPVGLLLATPLTVCVAVIGRYVPSLEFLGVLLSDEPVLKPEARFYQRMLAMDLEEATEIAEEFLKGRTLQQLEDQVIIPALIMAEGDRHKNRLDDKHEQFLFESTRVLMEHLSERQENPESKSIAVAEPPAEGKSADGAAPIAVACVPARGEADEIACRMLLQLLESRGVRARVLPCTGLAGECIEQVKRTRAGIACVTLVPPAGYMHARYLCRRLRDHFPQLKLVAAVLTEAAPEDPRRTAPGIQADEIVYTLEQAVAAILSLMPTAAEPPLATAP